MNWTQTLVLAAAVLVAGLAMSNAQTPAGVWFIGSTGSAAWIASPDGRVWQCQRVTPSTSCERVDLP